MTQPKTNSYDSKEVAVIIHGNLLTGFAEGSRVNVARRNPSFELVKGSDGEGAFNPTNDKSGTITVTLLSTSAGNSWLSGLLASQEAGRLGDIACAVEDNSGNSLHFGAQCRIEGWAEANYEQQANAREWTILVSDLEQFIGGNGEIIEIPDL